MKLELKHLAPYLPYGLKLQVRIYPDPVHSYNKGNKGKLISIPLNQLDYSHQNECWRANNYFFESIKPILKPLSDLLKEDVDVNGYEGYIHYLEETYPNHSEDIKLLKRVIKEDERWTYCLPKYLVEHLYEWHFDIDGLIEEGLAIDINTLD